MQRAVFVTEAGKPLSLGTRAIPEPQEGQIQVKVDSTMLLPHDTYGRDLGLFFSDRLPFVLGTNITGTVTQLGSSVSTFSIGDHVFGLGSPNHLTPDMAGLQQYALLSASSSAKIPSGFTADEMATFPVNAVTSFAALFDGKGFGFPAPFPGTTIPSNFNAKEKTILVMGGGSSVGKMAIQYAKLAGIGQVIAIASAGRTEELKKLGATHVIDRHASAEEIRSQVKEVTGQDGEENIYDCVSWDYTLPISLLSTTKPSVLLTLHPAEEAEKQAKEKRPKARVQFILGTAEFIQPATKKFWEALPVWVKEGALAVGKYRVVEGLDLGRIEGGLDSYRDGRAVTPVVVHPNSQ